MYFIDLFSGIGGFRSALEREGHECLAFAEIDKHARQSYKAIYNTENEEEWHDVTAITDEQFNLYRGVADIIVGGFPCQAFSVAGKRKGFEDTRGTLFFEVARAIKEIQPRYALLENVKGLFSHDKGRTFGTIIQALDELGYIVEWGLFNSKFWGVPQNRERVYILATRKDVWTEPKIFNLLKQQTEVTAKLIDVLEDEVDEDYFISQEKTELLLGHVKNNFIGSDENEQIADYRYDEGLRVRKDKLSPCLRANNKSMGAEHLDMSNTFFLLQPKSENNGLRIAVPEFKEKVRVRKFEVDKTELSELLKTAKRKSGLSNSQISKALGIPETKVAHYFRTDKSFAIPGPEIWFQLKDIIDFPTDKFDEAITVFEVKDGEFDTSNRIYDPTYLSPTVNASSQAKIAIPALTPDRLNKRQNGRRFKTDGEPSFTLTSQDVHGVTDGFRIRKLTPLECWRLQGFKDEQFYAARDAGVSNSQLYKQAGNSVTVDVVHAIIKTLEEE